MASLLAKLYLNTLSKYCNNTTIISEHWQYIYLQYTQPNRYYHNLNHIQSIISVLDNVQDAISNWPAIVLATFYHDAIYQVHNTNNEEQSAHLAVQHLQSMQVPNAIIKKCEACIIATATHTNINADIDIDLFLDADLCILGSTPLNYNTYKANIAKEYSIYTKQAYTQGRIKVLQHFLAKASIYKHPYFINNLEQQARRNLQAELQSLEA
jgi:predicted metal-dependent HD superfamily phosphohydrolase